MNRLASLKASKNARIKSRINSDTLAAEDPINQEVIALETQYATYKNTYDQLQNIFGGLLNSENKESGLNANNKIANITSIIPQKINNINKNTYKTLIQDKYAKLLESRTTIENNYLIPLQNLSGDLYKFNNDIIKKNNDIIAILDNLKKNYSSTLNNPNAIQKKAKLTFYQTVIIPKITKLKADSQDLYEDTFEDLDQHTKVANNIIIAFKYQIKNYVISHFMNIIENKVTEIQKNLSGITGV